METSEREWTEERNERRCDLIDKEVDGCITDAERAELAKLQGEMLAYRRRVAPLPLDYARQAMAAAGVRNGQ